MSDEGMLFCMWLFGILTYAVLMGISICKSGPIDIDSWCNSAWISGASILGFTIILVIVRLFV